MSIPTLRSYFRAELTLESDTLISGVGEWLFLVEDAEGRLVASASANHRVYTGFMEAALYIASSTGAGEVAFPGGGDPSGGLGHDDFAGGPVEYVEISDHWHVFDGTCHWVVVTLESRDQSGLTQPTGVGVAKLSEGLGVIFARWLWNRTEGESYETQDLWAVARQGGIAIGVGRTAVGGTRSVKILLVDEDGDLVGEAGEWSVDELEAAADWPWERTDLADLDEFGIGGSGSYDPSADPPYRLLLPRHMSPCETNPVYLLEVNADWGLASVSKVFDPGVLGYNFTMPTEAALPDGYRAVAVRRVIDESDKQPQDRSAEWAASCGGTGDESPIHVYIFDADGDIHDTIEVTSLGSRPHIVHVGDLLYVCYDTTSGGSGRECRIATLRYTLPTGPVSPRVGAYVDLTVERLDRAPIQGLIDVPLVFKYVQEPRIQDSSWQIIWEAASVRGLLGQAYMVERTTFLGVRADTVADVPTDANEYLTPMRYRAGLVRW